MVKWVKDSTLQTFLREIVMGAFPLFLGSSTFSSLSLSANTAGSSSSSSDELCSESVSRSITTFGNALLLVSGGILGNGKKTEKAKPFEEGNSGKSETEREWVDFEAS